MHVWHWVWLLTGFVFLYGFEWILKSVIVVSQLLDSLLNLGLSWFTVVWLLLLVWNSFSRRPVLCHFQFKFWWCWRKVWLFRFIHHGGKDRPLRQGHVTRKFWDVKFSRTHSQHFHYWHFHRRLRRKYKLFFWRLIEWAEELRNLVVVWSACLNFWNLIARLLRRQVGGHLNRLITRFETRVKRLDVFGRWLC